MTNSPTQTDRQQHTDIYGHLLVSGRRALLVICGLTLVILALSVSLVRLYAQAATVKPLIVRINDVGRADVVNYDATTYVPQPPELRYFLTRFVVLHYSRQRSNVRRDFPNSLYFLSRPLADAAIAHTDQSRVIETFLTDPSADEITVDVQNVTLTEWSKPPYRAAVDFVKRFTPPGASQSRRQETFIAQIDFVLRDRVSNDYVTVNPLGLQVLDLHLDQAF